MNQPIGELSDQFDISVEQLLEPSDLTRHSFEAALGRLPVIYGDLTRSARVGVANDDGDMSIVAEVEQHFPASSGRPAVGRIGVDFYCDGEHGFISTTGETPHTKERYQKVLNWLQTCETDPLVEWLREAVVELEATRQDTDWAILSAGRLLDDAPVEAGEHSMGSIDANYANGTCVFGDRIKTNDAFLKGVQTDPAAAGISLNIISLVVPDGKEYLYTKYMNGNEELNITDPKTTVPREVTETDYVDYEIANGLGMTISGAARFMRAMRAEMADEAEARTLGLLTPTEGKMKAFTAALGAAIFSGRLPQKPAK